MMGPSNILVNFIRPVRNPTAIPKNVPITNPKATLQLLAIISLAISPEENHKYKAEATLPRDGKIALSIIFSLTNDSHIMIKKISEGRIL